MTQNLSEADGNLPNTSETFGNIPKVSESFRTVPQSSEDFGRLPQAAEAFSKVPNQTERKESHTLTVREAARLFEVAGVARTERSIINWCQPNRMGVARLDCYFDPNERKYFLTPQSVELAIAEEKAKANKEPSPSTSEASADVPNASERRERTATKHAISDNIDNATVAELQKELTDLKITNRAKDYYINQLKSEREGFATERQGYVEKLMSFTRTVGQLETQLRQLNAPRSESPTDQITKE